MSHDTDATFLTQEAYDRLAAELEHLSTDGREEIAKKIEAAREEGDLRENGGYHAAKDQQGMQEARIAQLTQLLRTAVISTPTDADTVEPGMLVTATIAGDETTFVLGNREIAGDSDLSVYSPQSPLGEAISGLKVGDEASYAAPNGKEIRVKVLALEIFTG